MFRDTQAESRNRRETHKFGNTELMLRDGIVTISCKRGMRLEEDWDAAVMAAWERGYTLMSDDPTFVGTFYNVYLLEPIH